MPLHRVRRGIAQFRDRTDRRQLTSLIGEPSEQPAHDCRPSCSTGVQLTDAIASEVELLLEQLLVLPRNRPSQGHRRRPGGHDLRSFGECIAPGLRRLRPGQPGTIPFGLLAISQPLPDQLSNQSVTETICKHGLQKRSAQRPGQGLHGLEPKTPPQTRVERPFTPLRIPLLSGDVCVRHLPRGLHDPSWERASSAAGFPSAERGDESGQTRSCPPAGLD